jgi:acyl-CoA dehydrogenase
VPAQVIGTEFYVMEFAEGRVFLDPNLPELTPQQRAHV